MPGPTPPSPAALGRAVRQLRQERKLSIEALADLAGMHTTFLSGIERGRYNPSWKKLGPLAQALGLELSEVVERAQAERDGYG